MNKYKIIDISNWSNKLITLKGTKEKEQLVIPEQLIINSKREVFFKEPAENSGDTWSEKLASEIGKVLGFRVHEVDLAIRNGILGALVYYSLEDNIEELKEGADLIVEEEFDKEKRTEYNFQLIEKTLNRFDKNLIKSFLEIIIFDILIGNTDRHSQNWGLIFDRKTGEVLRVAHAYDNSSSLGREFHSNQAKLNIKLIDYQNLIYLKSKGFNLESFNYSDDDFKIYHEKFMETVKKIYPKEHKDIFKKSKRFNLNSFMSYNHKTNDGSYMIGWDSNYKISHFDFFKRIYLKYPTEIKNLTMKISVLSDAKITALIDSIPTCIMADLNKEFVKKFLMYRRDFMLAFISKEKKDEI